MESHIFNCVRGKKSVEPYPNISLKKVHVNYMRQKDIVIQIFLKKLRSKVFQNFQISTSTNLCL